MWENEQSVDIHICLCPWSSTCPVKNIGIDHCDSLFSGTSIWGGKRFKKLPLTGWFAATADSSSVSHSKTDSLENVSSRLKI